MLFICLGQWICFFFRFVSFHLCFCMQGGERTWTVRVIRCCMKMNEQKPSPEVEIHNNLLLFSADWTGCVLVGDNKKPLFVIWTTCPKTTQRTERCVARSLIQSEREKEWEREMWEEMNTPKWMAIAILIRVVCCAFDLDINSLRAGAVITMDLIDGTNDDMDNGIYVILCDVLGRSVPFDWSTVSHVEQNIENRLRWSVRSSSKQFLVYSAHSSVRKFVAKHSSRKF